MIGVSPPRSLLLSPWPYHAVRLALAGLFLYAGVLKLLDTRAFARVIAAYELAPDWSVAFLSVGLPLVEVLTGLGLAMGVRGSLSVITGLLVLFVWVLGFGVMNDLEIDCGCFSAQEVQERGSLKAAFYRDIGFVAAAGYLYWWRWRHKGGKTAFPVRKNHDKEGWEK